MTVEGFLCPACKDKGHLIKSRRMWSGRKWIQKYYCLECGGTTETPLVETKKGSMNKATGKEVLKKK